MKPGLCAISPQVPVRVGEVARIAAVERLVGGPGDPTASAFGRCEDLVDLASAAHVVRQGDAVDAGPTLVVVDCSVLGELCSAPQDDCDAARLKEHRALDLLASPTQRRVEVLRLSYVFDTYRHQAHSLLHARGL
jgi:hypothetical protein